MKSSCLSWSPTALLLALLLNPVSAFALVPEPGNIYFGIVCGLWGEPLTGEAGAEVVLWRGTASNRVEVARSAVFGDGVTGPNFILRVPLDSGGPARYADVAVVSNEAVTVTVFLQGLEYSVRRPVPNAGGRGALREIDPVPTDDFDGDGMSDSWERLVIGTVLGTPEADDDLDGLSNLAEFRAGTDPLSDASALRIESVQRGPDSLRVEWSRVPGRTYVLEWKDRIDEPWSPVPAGLLSGPNGDTIAVGPAVAKFIRVRVDFKL